MSDTVFSRWLAGAALTAALLLSPGTGIMAAPAVFLHQRAELANLETGASLADYSSHGIHFVCAGNANAPIVVLIHGTPGSWRHWRRYLASSELQQIAHLVAVDRPGWGQSVDENGTLVLPFSEQAIRLAGLIDSLKREYRQPVILVGHSLGASFAPRVYRDYPSLVDGMLLINGAHDPDLANTRWYHHFARFWPVRHIIGADLRRANAEVFALSANLRALKDVWDGLDIPVTLIQGGKDWLVDPANADFVSAHRADAIRTKRYPTRGHFIPFRSSELVVEAIKELLGELPLRGLTAVDAETAR